MLKTHAKRSPYGKMGHVEEIYFLKKLVIILGFCSAKSPPKNKGMGM
jgi:hypothetical protein